LKRRSKTCKAARNQTGRAFRRDRDGRIVAARLRQGEFGFADPDEVVADENPLTVRNAKVLQHDIQGSRSHRCIHKSEQVLAADKVDGSFEPRVQAVSSTGNPVSVAEKSDRLSLRFSGGAKGG